MKINYIPKSNVPLQISKPSIHHKSFFIYEKDECDPITGSGFKSIKLAIDWIKQNFPDHIYEIDPLYTNELLQELVKIH